MSVKNFVVYRVAAQGTQPEGYVVNTALWDGQSEWSPPDGCAAAPDPDQQYSIGMTYVSPNPTQ